MLFGKHINNLDSKGRVFLPSKFRNDLGSSIVLLEGYKPCIMMFTEDEFLRFYEKLIKNGSRETDALDDVRKLAYSSETLEPDSQGRIMIPEGLRGFAGLKKEVAFIGVVKYVEIWDAERLDDYVKNSGGNSIENRLKENGY